MADGARDAGRPISHQPSAISYPLSAIRHLTSPAPSSRLPPRLAIAAHPRLPGSRHPAAGIPGRCSGPWRRRAGGRGGSRRRGCARVSRPGRRCRRSGRGRSFRPRDDRAAEDHLRPGGIEGEGVLDDRPQGHAGVLLVPGRVRLLAVDEEQVGPLGDEQQPALRGERAGLETRVNARRPRGVQQLDGELELVHRLAAGRASPRRPSGRSRPGPSRRPPGSPGPSSRGP